VIGRAFAVPMDRQRPQVLKAFAEGLSVFAACVDGVLRKGLSEMGCVPFIATPDQGRRGCGAFNRMCRLLT